MICDHMEKGFLDNIIDMLKHDETLFPVIIDMVKDERLRVRIGATALVEELVKDRRDGLVKFIPEISRLLEDPNPTIRGDGANLLGIIKHSDALSFLDAVYNDPDAAARAMIHEAIEDIRQN
ncbi:MAG: HEAT repeat domain-containing protein [Nitrospirae bacterium]|nr:MAG: HEAT repeat domain-containing protein [Nitrospirota bacterium]